LEVIGAIGSNVIIKIARVAVNLFIFAVSLGMTRHMIDGSGNEPIQTERTALRTLPMV